MHAIVCKYNHSHDRGYTQNTKVAIIYASIYHWLYLLIKSKRKNDDSLRTNIFLQTYRISYRNKFFQKEFNLRLYEDLKQKKKWILISIRKITFQNTCRKYLYVILSCKKYIAY